MKAFAYMCPKCKTPNPRIITYCVKCGHWMLDGKFPGIPISEKEYHRLIDKGYRGEFVSQGERRHWDQPNSSVGNRISKKWGRLWWIIGIILLAWVLYGIYQTNITTQANYQALIARADLYIESKEYENAITAYTDALKINRTNDIENKLRDVQSIADTRAAEQKKEQERIAAEQKKEQERILAEEKLKKEIEDSSKNFSEGNALKEAQKHEEAIEKYKLVVEKDEANFEQAKANISEIELIISSISFDEGFKLYKGKKYEDALNAYNMVIKRDTEHYANAQKQIVLINEKLFALYVKQAKDSYAKKDYTTAVAKIRLAHAIKGDKTTEDLMAKYEIAKSDYDAQKLAQIEYFNSKDKMETYEFGIGSIGIACQTKTTKTFSDGYTTYSARENSIFVWVGVSAYNNGESTEHVNPTFITLSTPNGVTHNVDMETTFALDNYFEAIDLPSQGSSSGWLIFLMSKEPYYTLHYNGFLSSIDKKIVVGK